MSSRPTTAPAEEVAVVAAVRGGDAAAFSALAERYRPQLLVHCWLDTAAPSDVDPTRW